MGPFRTIFCALAALGFVASVLVHFSTFAGVDPVDEFPLAVPLLHVGIFVVFVPAIIWSDRQKKPGQSARSVNLAGAPAWLGALAAACFIYALVNFAIFAVRMHDGRPNRQPDGSYAITSKGKFVRAISEEEFHRYQSYMARGFSGHWMLFYSFSLAMLLARPTDVGPAEREEDS